MNYKESFQGLMINTGKGFGVGIAIAAIITLLSKYHDISLGLGLAIMFGSLASIFFCSRSNVQGYMNTVALSVVTTLKNVFFTSIFSGGGVLLILGIAKVMLGIIIMIPVCIYMTFSYVLNIIYFTIMFLLEKFNKLEGKEELCSALDKIVPVASLVLSLVVCVKFFSMMA